MTLRFPAIVLFLVSALPLAACGGTTTGTGGGGTSDPNAVTCAAYCAAGIACLTPDTCVLPDPASAQSACASACETALASLSAADRAAFDPCMSCILQAAGSACPTSLPKGTCDAQCNTTAASAAGEKFSKAAETAPTASTTICTNGKVAFSASSCSGGGDSSSCTSTCCNGDACTTPDVGFTCTGASLDQCTCTAGKNKGKTFQGQGSCGSDPWNECNL